MADPLVYHCWPLAWRKAAVEAGLAAETEYGSQILGGDDMRNRLEKFATKLLAASMNEERCREIINPDIFKQDGSLYSLGWYLCWSPGDADATLDGTFTADELEAIAWWMKQPHA